MAHFLEHIKSSAPAIPALIMAAGTGYMVSPDAPEHVRYGGGCLLAIAVMLADMQSGKKMGYSDKIVKAVRKIPGLEKADEGTVLGMLTMAACSFLGGGEVMNVAENGLTVASGVKIGVNTVSYPLSGAIDFQKSRLWIENSLGKELRFKYTDPEGKIKTTKPISIVRLLQQVALLSGAIGIYVYGYKAGIEDAQLIGELFAASNILGGAQVAGSALKEIGGAKIESLKKKFNNPRIDEAGMAEAHEEWQDAKKALGVETSAVAPVKIKADDIRQAIEPVVSELNINPEKGKGR